MTWCWFCSFWQHSVLTSSTNICGDQDLLLAISEAVDNSSPLLHLHLPTEQSHLVALSRQLPCQPACSLPCLDHAEESAVTTSEAHWDLTTDPSAAFDKIDHDILLDWLKGQFGIAGLALTWLKSYLSEITLYFIFFLIIIHQYLPMWDMEYPRGLSWALCVSHIIFHFLAKLYAFME